MITSLAQFYNSAKWREFRRSLIAQRMSENSKGLLLSEVSGKPLLNDYDIVLHHKKELTLQNVNDATISLNPENIIICSQKEHNEIHNRFGYASGRKVYIVYGAPCAGKSTFVKNIKGNSDIVCDIDNIWQALTDSEDKYFKPNSLKQNVFYLRDCLLDSIKQRVGNWERAYIITGAPLRSQREEYIRTLGAELIFIDTSKQDCIERLYNDKRRSEQEKKEWKTHIERWFEYYVA